MVSAEVNWKLREIQVNPPFPEGWEEVSEVKVAPKGISSDRSLGLIKLWIAASSVSLGLSQKVLIWLLVLGDFSAGEGDQDTVFLQALEFQDARTDQ